MLSISIVTYKSDVALLKNLLESLEVAIAELPDGFTVDFIDVVENSNQEALLEKVLVEFHKKLPYLSIVPAGKNIGYGAAHNLSIRKSDSRYHLILNPDVILDADALVNGLSFMETQGEVIAISPFAEGNNGEIQYLTKQYPSVLDLFIRACSVSVLSKIFDKRLGKYENRQVVENGHPAQVGIISGCFILCRTEALQKAGGFDEGYFLYFEDFSLALTLSGYGKLMYCPAVKITHHGGNASRKGLRHIIYFVRSGWRFFNQHGWKFI